MNLKNKNILVFGLGKSGISCLKYLQKQSCQIFIYDDNKSLLKRYKRGGTNILSEEDIPYLDFAILSPGINNKNDFFQKLKNAGIEMLSELEFAFCQLKTKNIVAITGTNGKTTTTELCCTILSSAYKTYKCGNIGLPITDYIDRAKKEDYMAVEVSSFMLENIKAFAPKIAIITNLAGDHLDRYKSIDEYQATKLKITQNQQSENYLILNANLENKEIKTQAHVYYFSADHEVVGAYYNTGKIYFKRDINSKAEYVADISEVKLSGKHNIENILASVCCAVLCNVSVDSIQESLNSFNCIEHRFEKITTINGIEFVNDSKATNIHATLNAVKDVNAVVHLLLGGSDKGENFDELFANLPANVKTYLFGSTTNKMVNSCINVGFKNFKICNNMKDALEQAYLRAKKREMVLLSPACASFDSFNNFEERGKQFKEWVFALYEKFE